MSSPVRGAQGSLLRRMPNADLTKEARLLGREARLCALLRASQNFGPPTPWLCVVHMLQGHQHVASSMSARLTAQNVCMNVYTNNRESPTD